MSRALPWPEQASVLLVVVKCLVLKITNRLQLVKGRQVICSRESFQFRMARSTGGCVFFLACFAVVLAKSASSAKTLR